MSEREKLLREMEELTSSELKLLRSLLRSVRRRKAPVKKGSKKNEAYLKVRDALKGIRGSLADDISMQREDRI